MIQFHPQAQRLNRNLYPPYHIIAGARVVNLAVVQASGDACVDGPPPELVASTVNLATGTGAAAAQRHASVDAELPAGSGSDPPDRPGFGATAIPTSQPTTFGSATAGPTGCDASSPAAGQPSRTASTAPIPDAEPFMPVEPYALMQRGVSSAVCEALARTLSGELRGMSGTIFGADDAYDPSGLYRTCQ